MTRLREIEKEDLDIFASRRVAEKFKINTMFSAGKGKEADRSTEREDNEIGAGEWKRARCGDRKGDGENERMNERGEERPREREKASKCWSKRVGCWLHS